ncbi:MAG: hypothetical protein JNK85_23110 [Verrucomicrobiales bacterium]|nr:hypothetical protein [Verrucomicrobiales bacterium]
MSIVSTNTLPGALWNEGTFLTATNGVHNLALNITNTGLMELRPGTVEVSSAQFFQVGGELRLNGAQLNLRPNIFTDRPPLVLAGGELSGTGSIGFSGSGGSTTVTNLGTLLKPGLPLGVLGFNQRLSLAPGSTVEIELGGTTAGTQHDQLAVTGTIRLGGALRLRLRDGFVPAVGDQFTVATFSSRGGTTFANVEGQNIGGGKRLDVVHESTRVLVRCVDSP